MRKLFLTLCMSFTLFVSNSFSQTFIVDVLSDPSDNWFDCSGIPGWFVDPDGNPLRGTFVEGLARLNGNQATVINFAIPGAGPHVIQLDPANANPQLCASNKLIDGTTQQDASGNPNVTIVGRNWGTVLQIEGNLNVVQGLNFVGQVLCQNGASTNTIQYNFMGTNNTGTAASAFSANGVNGVAVDACHDNIINQNVIANSNQNGIHARNGALRTTITNNVIGFGKDGITAIPNGSTVLNANDLPVHHGIYLENNANFTTIDGNLIGNSTAGHGINSLNSSQHSITGNVVGLDSTGLTAANNRGQGVLLEGGTGSTIGGLVASERNIISGNGNAINATPPNDVSRIMGHGIELRGSSNNVVIGNWVGLDITGNGTVGNHLNGIYVQNAGFNTIGGATDAHRNTVGGNGYAHIPTNSIFSRHGIQLDGNFWTGNGPSTNNSIEGNWVGVGVDGTTDVGNSEDGISVYRQSNNNTVTDNVVVNNNEGIFVQTHSDNNTLRGNYVGVGPDITGNIAMGNTRDGIKIHSGDGNIIGGAAAGQGNWIVANGDNGIHLLIGGDEGFGGFGNDPTTTTTIYGNTIGHDGSTPAYANGANGILISDGSNNNTIGGTASGQANIIANNPGHGLLVNGGTTIRNTIAGNEIYCNGGRGIELNNTGNLNYASSGSGGSAELYVNNASTAPNFLGIAPANAVIDIYRLGTCNSCGASETNQVQGRQWLGSTTADGSGNWSVDLTTLSVTGADTVGWITVTATDANGNTSEFAQCVTVCSAPPSATLSPSGTIDICQGDNQLLTATPAGYHYTFMLGAAIVQSGTSATYTASVAGSYTVVIADPLDTANVTCQVTSNSVTLNVNNLPNTSAITGTTPVCDGDVETYSVTNTVGSSYNWTVPAGANITGGQGTNSITVDWSGASSGNVSVTETNAATCVGSAVDFAVTVNSLPSTSAIVGATPVCDGDTTSYTVTNTAGSSYNWSAPAGANIINGQGSNSINVDWSGASSGNVSVTETNAAGCSASSATTLAVTVNSRPITSAITGNTGPACSATGEVYSVTDNGGTYVWTVPTGATITGGQNTASITVDFGTSNGFITVTETGTNTCVGDPVQLQITLSGCGLSANFSGTPLIICVGESVTFTDLSAGNPDSWTWDFGAGANPATANTQGPHVVQYTTPGSKTVQLVVTEGAAVDTLTEVAYVTVNDTSATSSISGTDPVCANETGTQYFVSGGAGSTYSWTTPGGTSIVGAQDGDTITVDWGTTGGLVTVQETNASGCTSAQQSMNVTVNPFPDDPGPITGPTGVVCDNGSGNTYTFSIPTVANADTVIWTVPAGATIVSGQGTTSITVDFVAGASQTVSVAASNSCGPASNPATYNVDVDPTLEPDISILPDQNGVCGNETITATAFVSNAGTNPTIDWYLNGTLVQSDTSTTYASASFVDGDSVTAIVTSNATCATKTADTSDIPIILSIQTTPVAEAGPDASYPNPTTHTITTPQYQTSTPGATYVWSSSVDDLELNITNPPSLLTLVTADPTEPSTWYTLTVTNSLGCSATDSLLITIEFDIYIPSGFTPNNDGNNDKFQIKNIDKYPGNKIWIYNRWGSLVYEGTDYGISEPLWGGTKDGKDLPMATYYYILDLNNGTEQIAGPVTIVK